uniref:Uncharacterized protein n=1 Tax=Setaria viridis TaxID=4556 RepID=A0A4U6VIQ7_SETVI|nr:LOW QUALITY PROTEIN: hypothetical protein SEVIR_3G340000v2 [Setaria viridis]
MPASQPLASSSSPPPSPSSSPRSPADGVAGGAARVDKWRYRLVEDEVAPEFGGVLATNSNGGRISTGALNRNRPGCQSGSQCAGKPAGGSYTRPCTYRNQCRGG